MDTYVNQIDLTADRDCWLCLTEYCEKMTEVVKEFRKTAANLQTNDFTTLNRSLGEIEHVLHEMEEQAEDGHTEDIHHTHETLKRNLNRLKEEVGEII